MASGFGGAVTVEAVREIDHPGDEVAAELVDFQARRWIPLALLITDIVALELSLLLGMLIRSAFAPWFPIEIGLMLYVGPAIGILILPVVFAMQGLYPGYGTGTVDRIRHKTYGILLVFSVLLFWDYLIQDNTWSRGILLATMVVAIVILPLAESRLRRYLVGNDLWGVPVFVIGGGRTGAMVIDRLQTNRVLGYVPAAVFDDNSELWGSEVQGVPLIGSVQRVYDYADRCTTAVVAMPSASHKVLTALVEHLPFRQIIVVPDLMGVQSVWTSAKDLGGVLGLQIKRNLLRRRDRVTKRVLDLVLTLPLLVLTTPVILISAIAIKLRDPGPAFYAQEREGLHGRIIRIWKLRTMYRDAEDRLAAHLEQDARAREEWERFFKLKDDPRILGRVGRFLRRTSIDELPQLWQVASGELSLVGPRPLPIYHLDGAHPDFVALRRSVRPGITGMWQINARGSADLETLQTLDNYYIRNWSPWLDLYVLCRTFAPVVQGRGAH